MSHGQDKNQFIFTEPAQIDAVLSNNGSHDRATVALLKKAMGQKLLPLRVMAIPAPADKTGPYDDVNYVTVSPSLVPQGLRYEIDLVAEWIKSARQTNAAWLNHRTADGQIVALSRGFDKASAEARKYFFGTKRKPEPVLASMPGNDVQIITFGNERTKTVYSRTLAEPLTAQQMTDILSYNIPDRLRISYNRFATGVSMRDVEPQISFHLEGLNSHTETRWSCNPDKGETTFSGWRGSRITKQLFANRLALYNVLGCPEIDSRFGDVGRHAFARLGFLPIPQSWSQIRFGLKVTLDVAANQLDLTQETKARIAEIIEKRDPRALWELVDMPERINGKPIGYALLKGIDGNWSGTYDLNNPEQLARTRAYVGADVLDGAMDNARKVAAATPTAPAAQGGSAPTGSRYRWPSAGPA